MSKRPLKLWAVVIGTRGRHIRYVSGFPRPQTFFTRNEARAYKYNENGDRDWHIVKFVEQAQKGKP